jgi:hypothetical protein
MYGSNYILFFTLPHKQHSPCGRRGTRFFQKGNGQPVKKCQRQWLNGKGKTANEMAKEQKGNW